MNRTRKQTAVEPWMQYLKDCVDKGIFKTESSPDHQESILMEPGPQAVVEPWITNTRPIDLELLQKGYLESPERDGTRHFGGLELLGEDMARYGVKAYWVDADEEHQWCGFWVSGKEKQIFVDRICYEIPAKTFRNQLSRCVMRCIIGADGTFEEATEERSDPSSARIMVRASLGQI